MQRTHLAVNPGPASPLGGADRRTTLRHHLAVPIALAGLLAVVGAGCAGSAAPATPSAVGAPAPSSAPAPPHNLEIKQFAYSPASVEVAPGTMVEWKNSDSIIHSVTSGTPEQPGGVFDSGLFDEGHTFTTTFTQPGTYPYFCTRHQFMRGEVRVSG